MHRGLSIVNGGGGGGGGALCQPPPPPQTIDNPLWLCPCLEHKLTVQPEFHSIVRFAQSTSFSYIVKVLLSLQLRNKFLLLHFMVTNDVIPIDHFSKYFASVFYSV